MEINNSEKTFSTENKSFPIASPLPRIIAAIIDYVVVSSILMIPFLIALYIPPFILPELKEAGGGDFFAFFFFPISILVGGLLFILYFIFPTHRSGQTLGKKLVHIKVVNATNGKLLGWRQLFIREVLIKGFVTILLYFIIPMIDILMLFIDKRKQVLHDKVINSLVVKV